MPRREQLLCPPVRPPIPLSSGSVPPNQPFPPSLVNKPNPAHQWMETDNCCGLEKAARSHIRAFSQQVQMSCSSMNGHQILRKPGRGESTCTMKKLHQRLQYLLGSQKAKDREAERQRELFNCLFSVISTEPYSPNHEQDTFHKRSEKIRRGEHPSQPWDWVWDKNFIVPQGLVKTQRGVW